MAYVYRHIRLDINQPFYIGVSTVNHRKGHKWARNFMWKDIVSKTAYEIEVLFDDISLEFAYEKEIEFIKLYGRLDLCTGTLCNLTNGGVGSNGLKQSKETVEKRMIQIRGRKAPWATGNPNFVKGRVVDVETRKRLGAAHKGIHITFTDKRLKADSEKRRPVLMYTLSGEFIKEFEGIGVASREMRLDCGAISKVANGKLKTTGNYIFKFKNI